MPQWLKDAVFYEIYPQSFYDTNGDGIGDLQGIIEKLDYVKGLGCNAIWLNPIYDSPFMDAGYDVRDYKKVAPRYGTNEDAVRLFEQAHKKGIKILLDLVPGHTSDTHQWFSQAKQSTESPLAGRYIFTNSVWEAPPQYKFVCGICPRDGNYLVNFFSSQPALNYGFYDITHPDWQMPCDHPDCLATVEALKDIMRFWLDLGADGFRVDMADSLVKNDEEKIATAKIWRGIREMLDKDYPQAALVSEWSNPERAINNAGFHMDFCLDHYKNANNYLFRYTEDGENKGFFNKNGKGNIMDFVRAYVPGYEKTKGNGYISMFTCNHDTPRLTNYIEKEAIKLGDAVIFTLPGVPFLYYGDEIGMKYAKNIPSVEGGFNRTGSRTPMQWNSGKNLGFSSSDKPYIPVDSSEGAPTVENQKSDPDSIYKVVTDIIRLRHENEDLQADGDFEVVYAEENTFPFIYRRGAFVIAVNPSAKEVSVDIDLPVSETIYKINDSKAEDGRVTMGAQSFLMIKTK